MTEEGKNNDINSSTENRIPEFDNVEISGFSFDDADDNDTNNEE